METFGDMGWAGLGVAHVISQGSSLRTVSGKSMESVYSDSHHLDSLKQIRLAL